MRWLSEIAKRKTPERVDNVGAHQRYTLVRHALNRGSFLDRDQLYNLRFLSNDLFQPR